jgi:hypothetical protein
MGVSENVGIQQKYPKRSKNIQTSISSREHDDSIEEPANLIHFLGVPDVQTKPYPVDLLWGFSPGWLVSLRSSHAGKEI